MTRRLVAALAAGALLGAACSNIEPEASRPTFAVPSAYQNPPGASEEGDGFEFPISGMAVGDSGWTVPWALSFDSDGRAWLDTSFPIEYANIGTVQLAVFRETDGFHVRLPDPPVPKADYGGGPHKGDVVVKVREATP